MKKILLCMVLAGLMMPVVAQEKSSFNKNELRVSQVNQMRDLGGPNKGILPINYAPSLIQFEWLDSYAGISDGYDRQCQGSVYPMTRIHDDGFIGAMWTNENEENPPFPGGTVWSKRGVAYTYSKDGGKTWSEQESRMGGIPVYWPSYAQWGPEGEAVLARAGYTFDYEGIPIKDGLVLFTRETKGEGKWTITPVPYPEGAAPAPTGNDCMAWARMATSGENHQYIHIVSPMDAVNVAKYGTEFPVFYYRSQDGKNFEIEGKLIPQMVGEDWPEHYTYNDNIDFAVSGNIVAVSFIAHANHGYIIKSLDNGDNWDCIKFFDSPIQGGLTAANYADTVYVPVQGCIALDKNGKVHVAFSMTMSLNTDQVGFALYFVGIGTSFLSYWNEDMEMMDGDADFKLETIDELIWTEYLDWDLSNSSENRWYVVSTEFKWPVVGFYFPMSGNNFFTISNDMLRDWGGSSYRAAGEFTFPQMAFDVKNNLHLVYVGWLDGGAKDTYWYRHPFYTTTTDGGKTWPQTDYIVDKLDLIDQEFAYPVLAGINNKEGKMYLMAQVDPYPGVATAYNGVPAEHGKVDNLYYFVEMEVAKDEPAVNEIEALKMYIAPNPASDKVTVRFDGKGDITIYNILGQTVYHVENVVKEKEISLNNLTTGVYFVNVRSGNATATQKLIVK